MPEIPPPVQLKCDGCGKYFDAVTDVATAQIGASSHKLCPSCWTTALGREYPLTFAQAAERDAALRAR